MVLMARHEDEIPDCFTHLLKLQDMRIAGKRRLADKREARAACAGTALRKAPADRPCRSAPASREPVVEMCGVTVRYGRRTVLRGLDELLREETSLPITIVDDPLSAVVLGSGKALDNLDVLKEVTID